MVPKRQPAAHRVDERAGLQGGPMASQIDGAQPSIPRRTTTCRGPAQFLERQWPFRADETWGGAEERRD